MIRARRILRVSITVSNLEALTAFYCDKLGFVSIDTARPNVVRLRLGAQEIELMAFDPPGEPYPADSTAHDPWFQHLALVVRDIEAAWALVRDAACPITTGPPQLLPPNTGSVRAWKFRDPDGHPLELIEFPPGVGDPVWQQHPGLFLGIDHTAIVVADAARSAAFYEQRLGFARKSASRNQGAAQQRLDAIPGDLVDVAALGPYEAPTPHLELLGYRVPKPAARPEGMKIRDIASARTVVEVDGGDDLVMDPDGHLIQLQRADQRRR